MLLAIDIICTVGACFFGLLVLKAFIEDILLWKQLRKERKQNEDKRNKTGTSINP